MTLLTLASAALASPDRVASSYEAGTWITDVVASDDGLVAAWVENGAGTLTVLDTGTFDATITTVCSGARGLAVTGDDEKGWTFFVGCEDGTVAAVDVSTDLDVELRTDTWDVATGAISGVETDGTDVYVVYDDPDDGASVTAVSATDGTVVSEDWPVTLSSDTVDDTALVGESLVIAHGASQVSKVITSTATALYPTSSLGSRTLVDLYPYTTASAVYLADEGGGLVKYSAGTNDYIVALYDVADTVTAVGINVDEGWMILGAGDDALLYDFDAGTLTENDTIVGASGLTEIATIDGYAFGASDDGSVKVLTDRPWVAVDAVSPSTAVDGDEVSVTFSSDTAGTYEVVVGGTVDGDGTVVAEGDLDALESVTETFVAGTDVEFDEGDNRVWVFVTDAAGLGGRAAGIVTVDNPPGKVTLGEAGVGFGNGSISVDFTALDVSDIDSYAIYIDVEPFTAADYPTGGPGFTGDDDITTPVVATAEAGASVSRTIYPLTNGTTYYVAVRATDEGGQEGPMSDVQSATPEETYSASVLAGDEGGYLPGICGFAGGLRAGIGGAGLALLAVVRRRRATTTIAAGASAALLLAAAPARAATDDDESPRTMNVQLRYGPTTVADTYVQQVFGSKSNEIFWFEYGYASRFVDANLGLGFYQEMGWLQTAEGGVSDEHDMFTMFPIALTVTGRLDILDEQPIVPFARVGLDYWMWKENWYVADPDTTDYSRDGGKYGWHFGGGLMILLDTFDRRAASRLEATTGINDTYLVGEYRRTLLVHGDQQLNLSSSEISFGLKFDF